VLPSHNEEKTLASVIKPLKEAGIDIFVVDDGSQDDTDAIASSLGAEVIRHQHKKGKGQSLKDGFKLALEKSYDYIIAIDADGQHNPREAGKFIKTADKEGGAGIIIGNRLHKPKGMPVTRLLTNKIMSKIISAICKQHIPDTQCGYRLIKREVLQDIYLRAHKFEIESELLIKAAKAGYKIISVPIETIYADEVSHINPFIDTLRFIRFIVRVLRKE